VIRFFNVTGKRVPHTFAASLAAVVLSVLSALPATAQDPAPLSRLDPSSKYAVDLVIDSAVALGLPPRSILSKALEGIAKKAESRKIVDAVRKRLTSLRTARAVLGGVGSDELEAAASVLEAGARPEQLEKFRPRQQGRSDLEAFTVWADFLARGIPKDEASSAITKLWQDGADDATFHSLWNNVQSDILQGLTPGTALQNRIRETPGRTPTSAGKPPEGL
jgi:hypothetical protein